jgi:hypothetical protein
MRTAIGSLLLTAWAALLIPTPAAAQSLTGVVRDTSGAVLPGVTVEAASPALIERARSTATDGTGQYRITDLPPGAYTLTYRLPGFAAVVREGVDLTGGGVTTINVEMPVGSRDESITVTTETPVVDAQSTRRQEVLNGDVIRALPASRGHGNYIAAVPALQGTGFNSSAQPTTNFFTSRGGRGNEGAIQLDGMNVGTPGFGGGVSGYLYDMSNAAEVQVSITGGLGESERGGPTFNIIPKSGGNAFSGTYFGSVAGNWAQSSNIDDELRSLGFVDPPVLHKAWDTNIAIGGPIVRDRLWFFGNTRLVGSHQDTQNQWANKNAGDPNLWTWAKDEDVRVRLADGKRINSMRLTWQATQRNKFGFYIDYTNNCSGSSYVKGGDDCREPGDTWTASGPTFVPSLPTTSPESGALWDDRAKILQAFWSSPLSNRVLLESRFSSFFTKWGDVRPYGALTDFIPVTEQSTATGIPFANYIYRGWNATPSTDQQHATWRATLSYVTGARSLKVGYQGGYLMTRNTTLVGQQISYRFNSGSPNQLSQRVGPNRVTDSLRYDALFIQDQWTGKRLTLQGGVRYETARSWAPEDSNGIIAAHRFGGPLIFPRTEGVRGYHDLTPRMGAAYDVFGTGRTALKASLGKYTQGASTSEAYTINNPGGTLVTTVNRAWTDPNGNRVAECDFLNPAVNGECGEWQNLNWGRPVQTTQVNPDVLAGWGVRNYDWQFSVGVQHEIVPQVAVELSYNRRWWGNFFVTHNRALGPEDYDTVTLIAPRHPLLPGGGGYPVTFLTRNTNNPVGASDPYYTSTKDFGEETHYWHGVEVSFNARMRNGLLFQAGTSTGRGVNDTCDVQIARFGRPERLIGTDQIPDCRFTEPWLTTVRGLATYTIPKIDVMVSAIMRSQPNAQPGADDATDAARRRGIATNGASLAANYQMTADQFLAATGRSLTPGLTSQTVNLLWQGELYGDRINVVDLRVAKILRFGHQRATIGLDIYNLFNSNTPAEYEQVFDPATEGTRWMQPTSVLLPRFARLNIQFDF